MSTNTITVTQLHNLEAQQILNPLEELKNQLEDLKQVFLTKTPAATRIKLLKFQLYL